jgi:UDP-hydrolysing UDP-N-acetyl-D-glucosamine 2-epimerase
MGGQSVISSNRKVCVVVASRANYGRIKSVLKAIKARRDLELQLVVGASALLYRFGNAIDYIQRDGFKVDAKVYIILEGENPTTMAKSTGIAISEMATIFENLRPDVVLTVADRFETLGTTVAASYMNIAVAHTQGGEVTGSIDESVRHAVTKLAHIHFPATQKSAERIVKMGEDPATVFCVGCPSIDVIAENDLRGEGLDKKMSKYGGVGGLVDWTKPYLLVVQHPVTTEYGQGIDQINETLEAIHELGTQTVWLWPNVDAGSDDIAKGIRVFRERYSHPFIRFYRNFSVEDYGSVLNNALCIVGNSSSGIRESAFLGVPCVNIGSRQQGRERGPNVIDVNYSAEDIRKAIEHQILQGRYPQNHLYGDGHAGARIAEILATCVVEIQKKLFY